MAVDYTQPMLKTSRVSLDLLLQMENNGMRATRPEVRGGERVRGLRRGLVRRRVVRPG